MMRKNLPNTRKLYCTNCGKHGHYFRSCPDPISSYGIINFKYNTEIIPWKNEIDRFLTNKYIDLIDFNNLFLSSLDLINLFKDKIKFLLIQRKHSLSFIEFIRGRYEILNPNKITKLFNLMSNNEIKIIKEANNFTELWENLWKKSSNVKMYVKEFNNSKAKFDILKKGTNAISLEKLVKITSEYNTPEWGFPKGRRNNTERNFDCAIREFEEETNLEKEDINILTNIKPIIEDYIGTNGVNYKHLYYLALSDSFLDVSINPSNKNQNYEIGDIGWFTWEEATSLIRPYYTEKVNILNQVFLFAINIFQQLKEGKNVTNNYLI
jgi:8-oxo-dGTP pyrophosphatase MutT (NUDIX family)